MKMRWAIMRLEREQDDAVLREIDQNQQLDLQSEIDHEEEVGVLLENSNSDEQGTALTGQESREHETTSSPQNANSRRNSNSRGQEAASTPQNLNPREQENELSRQNSSSRAPITPPLPQQARLPSDEVRFQQIFEILTICKSQLHFCKILSPILENFLRFPFNNCEIFKLENWKYSHILPLIVKNIVFHNYWHRNFTTVLNSYRKFSKKKIFFLKFEKHTNETGLIFLVEPF